VPCPPGGNIVMMHIHSETLEKKSIPEGELKLDYFYIRIKIQQA
jgi:hypothetical protein